MRYNWEYARVVELVDTRDLKSLEKVRVRPGHHDMSLRSKLLSSSRRTKQLILQTDFVSILSSIVFSFFLFNLEGSILHSGQVVAFMGAVFNDINFYVYGIYNSVLRFIDFAYIYLIFKAVLISFIINSVFKFLFKLSDLFLNNNTTFRDFANSRLDIRFILFSILNY